jgi:hypothetical protein
VSYGEVPGDKSTMYIRVTVFSRFFQYFSGFILYHVMYGCMFFMLLFTFVNYLFLLLCYIFLLLCYVLLLCNISFVSLSILIVMYVPFCVF